MVYIAAYYLDGTTRYFADHSWDELENRLDEDMSACGMPTRTEQITAETYKRRVKTDPR